MLRAENAEVVIHPDDRKYGALLVGGQGTGKTSALLTFYKNDVECDDTAPIVIDPKSELSRLCLRRTPPDCGKRVWFLDLGRPAFGMNPLRLIGDRPLAIEAAQIAENIVAALLDINENQIYQSSRRYLNHAVIGAIAIASRGEAPREARGRLHAATAGERRLPGDRRRGMRDGARSGPDGRILPLRAARRSADGPGRVAERMDAPRNKISGLMGVPPLRRFFNHPTDIPLREIIEARDILIVDANMAAIGTDNSKACMLFILRMLQRATAAPGAPARARSPAGAVAGRRGALRTQRRERGRPDRHPPRWRPRGRVRRAVFRAARLGLRAPAEDPQGRAQPAAEPVPVPDGRRAGRRGDEPDRDGGVRDDDPRRSGLARAAARHTRAAAQLPQLLLSGVVDRERQPGARVHGPDVPAAGDRRRHGPTITSPPRPSASPRTRSTLESTLDDAREPRRRRSRPASRRRTAPRGTSRREYLQVPYAEKDAAKRLGGRVGPRREALVHPRRPAIPSRSRAGARRRPRRIRNPSTSPPAEAANGHRAWPSRRGRHHRPAPTNGAAPRRTSRRPRRAASRPSARCASTTSHRRRHPSSTTARSAASWDAGYPAQPPGAHEAPAPDSLRELAFLDRINEIGPAEQHPGAEKLPRLYDEDYAILALLDRAGLVPRTLIGRACLPGRVPSAVLRPAGQAVPPRADRPASPSASASTPASDGKPPLLYSLTRRGMDVAQTARAAGDLPPARVAADRAGPRPAPRPRPARARVGQSSCTGSSATSATDHWRTPRYATGRYQVPQAGTGRDRHPITLNEIPVPDKQAIIDLALKGVRRDQARPVARAADPLARAELRPTGRTGPHQQALLQPRQAPRLRRVPVRLEPRPPALPDARDAAGGRVRMLGRRGPCWHWHRRRTRR